MVKNLWLPYFGVNLLYYFAYGFGKQYLIQSGSTVKFYRLPPELSIPGLIEALTIQPAYGPFWFLRDLIMGNIVFLIIKLAFKSRTKYISLILLIISLFWESGNRFWSPYAAGLLYGQIDISKIQFTRENLNPKLFCRRETSIVFLGIALGIININWQNLLPFAPIAAGVCAAGLLFELCPENSTNVESINRFAFILYSSHGLSIGVVRWAAATTEIKEIEFQIFLYLFCANLLALGIYKAFKQIQHRVSETAR